MVLWILSSDTCEKPPLRWSTSSSSITVFPAIPDSLEKFSRETYCEPLVAEDLIAAAVNDAVRRVEKVTQEKMGGLASGINIPGLNISGMNG
ncbi:MAG: hypothetical protein CL979_02450 [Euryarchaeota archaeon]|nr:hypothetical protein [Euryarchaeota archaeon]